MEFLVLAFLLFPGEVSWGGKQLTMTPWWYGVGARLVAVLRTDRPKDPPTAGVVTAAVAVTKEAPAEEETRPAL